jgi:hypothetical protein
MDRRRFLFLFSAAVGLGGCGRSVIESNPLPLQTAVHTDQTLLADWEDTDRPLLRYRFRKGEELHWNVQHTLRMRNIIGGMEENIETRSRAVKIWKTLNVDANGGAIFEYRVEDIDLHRSQTGDEDVVYNSRRDKIIPPEFNNLEGKIGLPLAHIRIDPQGQTTKKPLREYDGSIAENRIVIPLPDEPVSIGSSWIESQQIDLPQSNQMVKKIRKRHEYTLEKIHSGLATIKFSTIPLTVLSANEEAQLLENFPAGTMELDLQAGHFIRHEATIDRLVVGIQGASDSIRYLSRVTECCCGRRACEICSARGEAS